MSAASNLASNLHIGLHNKHTVYIILLYMICVHYIFPHNIYNTNYMSPVFASFLNSGGTCAMLVCLFPGADLLH